MELIRPEIIYYWVETLATKKRHENVIKVNETGVL